MGKGTVAVVGATAAVAGTIAYYLHKKKFGDVMFSNRWFAEKSQMWPGQAMCLEMKKVLFQGRSKFQDVLVFESVTYGTVLVLDGVIQATERDEFAYQEMMTHVPMFSHPEPQKILIIGGGDGGCLREVVKHKYVQEIDLVEIDEMVVDVAKKYLPDMSSCYADPRLNVTIGDGAEFLKGKKNHYDVIIVDSSDPEGPAQPLFNKEFYETVYSALNETGVVSAQGECMWLDMEVIRRLKNNASKFPHVGFGLISIPTYPCGTIGVFCASKNSNPSKPLRTDDPILEDLRYYTPDIHAAAFVHPKFFDVFRK